ncbi:MAG: YaaC family protein [Solirubrobacteraceae bacterium]
MSAWQHIRLLRACPPGEAIGERAAVFASALEQSEQLMRAAEVVGPAARPLPLFYALSQAGRAIAAVHLPDPGWRLAGHGLSARPQDGVSDLLRR